MNRIWGSEHLRGSPFRRFPGKSRLEIQTSSKNVNPRASRFSAACLDRRNGEMSVRSMNRSGLMNGIYQIGSPSKIVRPLAFHLLRIHRIREWRIPVNTSFRNDYEINRTCFIPLIILTKDQTPSRFSGENFIFGRFRRRKRKASAFRFPTEEPAVEGGWLCHPVDPVDPVKCCFAF